MNREEAREAMTRIYISAISPDADHEVEHVDADKVLIAIVREHLGWHDVADLYEKLERWYA